LAAGLDSMKDDVVDEAQLDIHGGENVQGDK
jgi:hypothetical protein